MNHQENYNLTPDRPESAKTKVKRQVALKMDCNVNFYSLLLPLVCLLLSEERN